MLWVKKIIRFTKEIFMCLKKQMMKLHHILAFFKVKNFTNKKFDHSFFFDPKHHYVKIRLYLTKKITFDDGLVNIFLNMFSQHNLDFYEICFLTKFKKLF